MGTYIDLPIPHYDTATILHMGRELELTGSAT